MTDLRFFGHFLTCGLVPAQPVGDARQHGAAGGRAAPGKLPVVLWIGGPSCSGTGALAGSGAGGCMAWRPGRCLVRWSPPVPLSLEVVWLWRPPPTYVHEIGGSVLAIEESRANNREFNSREYWTTEPSRAVGR